MHFIEEQIDTLVIVIFQRMLALIASVCIERTMCYWVLFTGYKIQCPYSFIGRIVWAHLKLLCHFDIFTTMYNIQHRWWGDGGWGRRQWRGDDYDAIGRDKRKINVPVRCDDLLNIYLLWKFAGMKINWTPFAVTNFSGWFIYQVFYDFNAIKGEPSERLCQQIM